MSDPLPPPSGGEDPAFEIHNPRATTPLLLVCDHAAAIIPERHGRLGLDPAVLRRHVAWDIGAADLARRLSQALDATAVLSRFSRLLIDPNRPLDHPTLVIAETDGVQVPANRDLARAEIEDRIARYHRPYHDAIEAQLRRLGAGGQVPVLIAVHSFTPVMEGVRRPWHVGLLWNRDPRLRDGLLEVLGDDPSVVVGDNEPYSGKTHNYTTDRHGGDAGLPHISLEVRQDLIDTHHETERWALFLGATLRQVIAGMSPFTIRHYDERRYPNGSANPNRT
jgi:predicted N-formylglutamate amidohydrolase